MRLLSAVISFAVVCSGCTAGQPRDSTTSTSIPPTATTAAAPTTASTSTTTAATLTANEALAEAFIDAFYGYDPVALESILSAADASKPTILFYQGWAEAANYAIVNRGACEEQNARIVSCPITVEDDLIKALDIGFHVTDTFTLTIRDGTIREVTTSSDDPPLVAEAFNWVFDQNPDLGTGACDGFFFGGPTPGDCARAVVAGFIAFAARNE